MLFKKKKAEKPAAPAVNDDNAVGAAPAPAKQEKPGFKDKPRPVSVFREEAAKTVSVRKESLEQRGVVDTKLKGLQETYAPTLDAHGKSLAEAGEARIKLRRETVQKLTEEVGTSKSLIAELEKKLEEERTKLARSQNSLKTAAKELNGEEGKIAKEYKASMKAKKKELGGEISKARKERHTVYSQSGKKLRGERWNTFARTTKESFAVVPDLTARFMKAAVRGVGEVFTVFGRSAKSAKKGFDEPTLFSIRREAPVNPPKKEQKAKSQPPAPKQ